MEDLKRLFISVERGVKCEMLPHSIGAYLEYEEVQKLDSAHKQREAELLAELKIARIMLASKITAQPDYLRELDATIAAAEGKV